ncbi:protein kinase ssp1 [Saccharomyces pastorianus]|uniref:Protein kinase ssp1 n=1 Tax=Saccharomyces pastorianus TaxID=27292 RepID=A0A6C1DSY5_SACPS|nr:protein kinase ssp1 [Saccharomyces pastorianus]
MRSSGTYENDPSGEITSTSPKQSKQKKPTKFRERMRRCLQNGKNNNHQGEEDVPEIFNKNFYPQTGMTAFNNNDNGEVQDVTNNFFLPSEDESGPVQSSVKTFLTGNNDEDSNFQQNQNPKQKSELPKSPYRQKPTQEIALLKDLFVTNKYDDPYLNSSTRFGNITSTFPSSLSLRTVTLQTIKKRIDCISAKKKEVWKTEEKFLKDILMWLQSSNFEDPDTILLIHEIEKIFEEDIHFEQNVSDCLKEISNNFEYICMRETQLINEGNILKNNLKKYAKAREHKGEKHEDTEVLREKVISSQKSFDVTKRHYKHAISITTRQLFMNLAFEYYENCSDMKDISRKYLQESLSTLQTIDTLSFSEELEKIRKRRFDKFWAKANPDPTNNIQKFVNMRTGVAGFNDSLMNHLYGKLSFGVAPVEEELQNSQPEHTDVPENVWNEVLSDYNSMDGNPITSNKFLSAKELEPDQLVELLAQEKEEKEAKNISSSTAEVPSISQPEIKKENLESNDSLILRSTKRNVNVNAASLRNLSIKKTQVKPESASEESKVLAAALNDAKQNLDENVWRSPI